MQRMWTRGGGKEGSDERPPFNFPMQGRKPKCWDEIVVELLNLTFSLQLCYGLRPLYTKQWNFVSYKGDSRIHIYTKPSTSVSFHLRGGDRQSSLSSAKHQHTHVMLIVTKCFLGCIDHVEESIFVLFPLKQFSHGHRDGGHASLINKQEESLVRIQLHAASGDEKKMIKHILFRWHEIVI